MYKCIDIICIHVHKFCCKKNNRYSTEYPCFYVCPLLVTSFILPTSTVLSFYQPLLMSRLRMSRISIILHLTQKIAVTKSYTFIKMLDTRLSVLISVLLLFERATLSSLVSSSKTITIIIIKFHSNKYGAFT
jgi:hypothetical protein